MLPKDVLTDLLQFNFCFVPLIYFCRCNQANKYYEK